jgi:hypothetical protein
MHGAPLVVFGTPGSGTRVFARLAVAAGRDMGNQTKANDASALYGLAGKWCERIYPAWASGRPLDYSEFEADLMAGLEAHLGQPDPDAPWGWKQPRSLYMLPALHAVFPDLLAVHVIRDGRDMAFSPKAAPNLLLSGGYALPAAAANRPDAVKAATLWDEANRRAADFGEGRLGERYLRLSLEEACAEPERTAGRLVSLVGGSRIAPQRLRSIVRPPASLGRWRDQPAGPLAEVAEAAAEGLRRFGYAAPAVPC